MNIELVVLAFNETDKADEALKVLQQIEKEDLIEVVNAAVLTKDKKGKASFHETEDVAAGQGALFGAISGGLLGLIGGPAGVVVGAAAGAATGGVAAYAIDMGFSNKELRQLQEVMSPGSSALIALVEEHWAERVLAELATLEGTLFHQALAAGIAADLAATEATQDLEMAALTTAREAKRKEIYQRFEGDLAELQAEIETLEAKLAEADAKTKATLQQQLATFREKRDNARTDLHQKLESQLTAWQADINALKAKLAKAGHKVNTAVQVEINTLQNRRDTAWAQMQASLKAQKAALQIDIKALEAMLADAEAETQAKLIAQVADLRANIDETEQKLHRSLETQIKEVEAAVGEAQVEMTLAKMDAGDTYRDAIHTLYLKRHNLRWQLQHAIENEIEAVEAEIGELQVQATLAKMEAKDEIDELLASLYTRRSALRQKLQLTLTAQAQAWQENVETLSSQMDAAQAEAKAKIEKQLIAARAKQDATKARLEDFHESNQAAKYDITVGVAAAKEDLQEAVETAVAEFHN